HSAGDRAADVYIAQLRAKLGPAAPIRTVRGAGYTLETSGLAETAGHHSPNQIFH
ncbi:MAG TPA: helix-turn-helix domain-containing protein, partial [Streptosporangiaceae bacterium]|nr:helix-turn-helix domain-containing protein [Streptosporangiaceae bacterium]